MQIKILNECGYDEALLGLSLSYNTEKSMDVVAEKLASRDGGHNKFLESICVWIDIDAPRYFHQQLDTYRVGITKQSESTMHTIMKRSLVAEDFEGEFTIGINVINDLNWLIERKRFDEVKRLLPESFLQRRIICTNYKVLRNMIIQRETHKLPEWTTFCNEIRTQCKYKKLLP